MMTTMNTTAAANTTTIHTDVTMNVPTILFFIFSGSGTVVGFSDVAAAAALLFASSAAVQWKKKKKGPMMWPVFGIFPHLLLNSSRIYDWLSGELRRSGGTFSFRGAWFGGYYGVVTADHLNVEYILKTRFANFPKGPYFRERFSDLLGDGIFNADGPAWREQRRAAAAEMHSPSFAAHSAAAIARMVGEKLLPAVAGMAASGATVDLQDLLLKFTFDNICAAAFGLDSGCLLGGDDVSGLRFASAFERATELTHLRFVLPPFIWKPMRALDIGTERELRLAVASVHEFAEKTVSDRRRQDTDIRRTGSDLLSRFIGEDDGAKFYSDKFLRDFCISFVLAGRDTSSVALAWFFWLLHRHPEVEQRIVSELRKISRAKEKVFSEEDLKGMEYLQAALSESLRLYPSVPVGFKEAAEDDVLPSGETVRKGARVMYSSYAMARMPEVWGDDAGEFVPERWLCSEGGRRRGLFGESFGQFKYVVFNAGPRLCVGKRFAYTQMKAVAAAVLLRYRVVVAEGQRVAPKLATTLYMKDGLKVTFVARDEEEEEEGGEEEDHSN